MVLDADFVRIALLPTERDPELIIDPNTVAARLIAPELLQSIAGRDRQVVDVSCDVDGLQLSLRHAPEATRDASSGARVSLPE
jgi:hypothetical protein